MSSAQQFRLKSPLTLASKATLDAVEIAYETFGELNDDKSNAILLCHALTGDAHVTGDSESDQSGWWSDMVGPGRAIDTTRFFVICSNILGSCKGSTGPSSENPETKRPYGLDFPIITIEDMVAAQYQLVSSFGISKLSAVVGPSMGGMQALQWAISYPDAVARTVVIAASASLSPQALAFGTVGRHAISTDTHFENGNYGEKKPKEGLAIARMIGHITYLSKESITEKFGRKLQEKSDYGYHLDSDFQIESYLNHQGDKFVERFDANSYLYLSRALSYFDLEKSYGSLEKAFEGLRTNLLLMSISSDWLYPTEQSKEIARVCMRLNKRVTFCEVESQYGHDAFLIEPDKFAKILSPFLRGSHGN